jgi:GntR family transcriptional regulator
MQSIVSGYPSISHFVIIVHLSKHRAAPDGVQEGSMHMARYGRSTQDPKVTLVRAHSYLTDNAIIDDYGPKIGAHGVAVYHALNRFADRQTGICWPKIKTIGARILLSESSVKRALHTLKTVGLITIDPRWSDDGDRTSNLFTLIPLATVAKRQQAAADAAASPAAPATEGGGVSANPPPVSAGGEVGSAGPHHAEQDTGNKNSSDTSPDPQEPNPQNAKQETTRDAVSGEKTQRQRTCPHPAEEIHRFADEITICFQCFALLDNFMKSELPCHDNVVAA